MQSPQPTKAAMRPTTMDVGTTPAPLRAATRVLWCLAALLGVCALVYRWDRLASLADPRWQIMLTVLGLAIGAWLGSILVRGMPRFGRLSAGGAAALLTSQLCYLLLVWTNLKTEPLLWRIWWISVVAAVSIVHILWMRLTAATDRRLLMRLAIGAAAWAAFLLAFLALRPVLLADPFRGFIWIAGLPMAFAGLVSAWLWARGVRRFRNGVPFAVRVWWSIIAGVLLLVVGFYAGRVTAPGPDLFGHQFSPLARMTSEELEHQTASDMQSLKALSDRLQELEIRTLRVSEDAAKRRAAGRREWLTPDEEQGLRSLFISYLTCRDSLLGLVALHGGYDTVQDSQARARCILIGHAAGGMVFEYGLKLVNWFGKDPVLRHKLNEADPRWGVPAGMFDRIYDNVANSANIEALAELGSYIASNREGWSGQQVFLDADLQWITGRMAHSTQQIKALQLHPIGARWEQATARVKQDAYTPVYTTQSVVSTWIGDTRLVQWQPLITLEQIAVMKGKLEPGDILLERRSWYLSNAFLPGFWPHSAMYIGTAEDLQRLGVIRKEGERFTSDDPHVRRFLEEYLTRAADGHEHSIIEAVSEGVIFNSLEESMHADYVAVLRPRLTPEQKAKAISRCFAHIGKPYDFDFDIGTTDKLVCSELVYQAYSDMVDFDPYIQKVVGRNALPPLEIARKFLNEREGAKREMDFVLFLDGYPSQRRAQVGDEQIFCDTIRRERGFTQ